MVGKWVQIGCPFGKSIGGIKYSRKLGKFEILQLADNPDNIKDPKIYNCLELLRITFVTNLWYEGRSNSLQNEIEEDEN